jgi:phage anti-repressor protein
MNELIPISQRQISGAQIETVSARDLHSFLEIGKDFSSWVKAQIERGRLIENVHFVRENKLTQKGEQGKIEYHLSFDAAKHIGMMCGTEKGFQVRDYFLECERRARAIAELDVDDMVPMSGDALVQMALAYRQQERRVRVLERQQKETAASIGHLADGQKAIAARQMASEEACNEFTVMGYANYREIRIDLVTAGKIGKRATAIAKKMGMSTRRIRDPRFGRVNSYPEEALEQAFSEIIEDTEL